MSWTNPTCPQPGFTLPRRQFVTLNRGQATEMCRISLPMGRDRITCLIAPAERATRPQGTMLKSAHSLHSLEACDVYTKRVPTQWNGYQNCLYETVRVFQTNNNMSISENKLHQLFFSLHFMNAASTFANKIVIFFFN